MPIDTRELVGRKPGFVGMIDTDRPCGRCGYNLKGLPAGGKCPECGRPIAARRGVKRFTDNLTDAPMFYLKALALGAILLAVCSVVAVISLGVLQATGNEIAATIAGGAAVGWWIGVFVCTAQRPMAENTIRDVFLESAPLRWVNRGLQSAWALAVLAEFASGRLGSPGTEIAVWAARGLYVVGLLGLVPLSIQLSSLGDWAGDTTLAERFRISAALMAICGTLYVAGKVVEITGWKHWSSLFVLGPAKFATLGLSIAQAVLLWYLVQLAHICVWAIRNSATASEVAVRQARREADPMAGRSCSSCGYDLAGLTAFDRCPECGHLDESVKRSGLLRLRMATPRGAPTIAAAPEGDIPLAKGPNVEKPKIVSRPPIGVGRRWGEQGQRDPKQGPHGDGDKIV